jgi:hypothetical protein
VEKREKREKREMGGSSRVNCVSIFVGFLFAGLWLAGNLFGGGEI